MPCVVLMASLGTLLSVDLPTCHYLTPAARRGWRGVAAHGEDPERWYDVAGPRNGPPSNYWRQATDERVHTAAVNVVENLVSSGGYRAALPAIENLERRMGIMKPLLNRKLLGTWAPVLYRGGVVASLVDSPKPKPLSCTITMTKHLVIPAMLNVQRAGERRTKTNGYGTTDAHLEPGEEINLKLTGPGGVAESSIGALRENERLHVPWQSNAGRLLSNGAPLPGHGMPLGRISLLNDYLIVQRDTGGAIREVWLRCDNEPQFVARSDLYSEPSHDGRLYRRARHARPRGK